MNDISIDFLKKISNNLMFEMDDNEYKVLVDEFSFVLEQIDILSELDNIDKYSPMSFPFPCFSELYDDEIEESNSDILKNAKNVENNFIKIPKVVE